MTNEEMRKWIDEASYERLLGKWRFAPPGDPFFQGDTGKYYSEVMAKKRSENPGRHVTASKSLGW